MIDTTMLDEAPVSALERCRYPSKFCRNRRSIKRNGELHRFCDYHRVKANQNQKRWSKNRRGRWDGEFAEPPPSPMTSMESYSESSDSPRFPDLDVDASTGSFLSMLEMLQPKPFDASGKCDLPCDEQLSEFLRELLLPSQPTEPSMGQRDSYLAEPTVFEL